jgi:flagellar hook-length control protein FliK
MPLQNHSLSSTESLMGVSDGKTTVQQRIATTEAILSQMALDSGEAVFKAPAADNMLLAIPAGTVAATGSHHIDSMAGPIIQAPLNIQLTSDDAENALAGNVKWMTNEGVKNAVMTVTPHGMGPISVKIGINGEQMEVSIIATQHTTRDALESMLPRLREQLAVQGHQSVTVDVSDGKSEQSRSGNGQAFAESRNPAGSTPQDNQSNSSNRGEKTEYGRSDKLDVAPESFMAEDLQRVAARVVGGVDGHPVFDAYV